MMNLNSTPNNQFVNSQLKNTRVQKSTESYALEASVDPSIVKNQPTNAYFFTILINAQLNGTSSLPYQLGLKSEDYQRLLISLDDNLLINIDNNWQQSAPEIQVERSALLSQLMNMRLEERDDLITLLLSNRDVTQPLSDIAATVIATACLNSSHLWKTLAFNKRSELSDWIGLNFPTLAAKNTKMRWKRFFYLQLCQQGGDYICRAPSCGECTSFNECFLPEVTQNESP